MAQKPTVKQAAVARRIQGPTLAQKGPQINPITQYDRNVKDRIRHKGMDSYIAWQTASGKKPDFGAGQRGPGTPYREVEKKYKVKTPGNKGIQKPHFPDPQMRSIDKPKLPIRGTVQDPKLPSARAIDKPRPIGRAQRRPIINMDAKAEAIRRRLSGGK